MAGRGVTQNQKNRMAGQRKEAGEGSGRAAVSDQMSYLWRNCAGNLHGLWYAAEGSKAALLLSVR